MSQSKFPSDDLFLSQFQFVDIHDRNHRLPFHPFNKYQAYKQRMRAFENGVFFVLKHQAALAKTAKEREALLEKYKDSKEFVRKKYIELHKIEHCGRRVPSKVLFIELERFTAGLAKVSGLSMKHLVLGECFWAWQIFERPEIYLTPEYERNQFNLIEKETSLHSPLTQAQKDDLFSITDEDPAKRPAWYKKLPDWSQKALLNIIPEEKDGDWSDYLKTIPTTLRHLPGQANASKHTFEIWLKDPEQRLLKRKVFRQAVPTSYEMPRGFHERSALNNVQQLVEDIATAPKREKRFRKYWTNIDQAVEIPEPPVVHLGLLSSREQGNWLQKLIDFPIPFLLPLGIMGKENSTAYVANQAKSVAQYRGDEKHVFHINVPINSNRPKTAEKVDAHFLNYAKAFEEKLKQFPGEPDKKALLAALIEQLNNHDALPEVSGRNKNMYLAALYDLTTWAMGGTSIINCKSSKDRTGFSMIMADAMLVFYLEHHRFPKSNDGIVKANVEADADEESQKRKNFVDIFALLYRKGHQLAVAGFNSPGSSGIKDEHMIDDDIITELGADYSISKEIASHNKPKTNFDKFKKQIKMFTALLCVLASIVSIGLLASGVLAPAALLTVGLASYLAATLPVSVPLIIASLVPTLGSVISGVCLYLGLERWMNRDKRSQTFEAQGLIKDSKDVPPPPQEVDITFEEKREHLPRVSSPRSKPELKSEQREVREEKLEASPNPF